MKKLLAVLMLAALACGLLAGCGGGQKPAEKKEASKPIVLGLDDNFPPMGFVDENNKIVGFDIDLATEAAKRLNTKVDFKPIDWASKEAELKSGRVDMLWNGLDITEKRKENILFSDPYMNNRFIIFRAANKKLFRTKTKKRIALEARLFGSRKSFLLRLGKTPGLGALQVSGKRVVTGFPFGELAVSPHAVGRGDRLELGVVNGAPRPEQ